MGLGSHEIVAGIDVGGVKKGFHVVALRQGQYVDQLASTEPNEIADWCRSLEVALIGVDAPSQFSRDGKPRICERELIAAKIFCFGSPTQEVAENHPKNYYGWMLNGMALYKSLASTHPVIALSDGPKIGCFETFPQAVACALSGGIVSAKDKNSIRRGLLDQLGIANTKFESIDAVDAALCAWAAYQLALGDVQVFGSQEDGLIITPSSK